MIYLWYSHIIGPHISDVVPHSSYFMIMWNRNGVWKYSTQNETWFASSLSPSFRGQGSQVYPQHSSCGLNAELFRCMVLALEYGKNCKHKVSNGFKRIIWSHVLFSLRFRVYINKLSCCDHSRVGGYHQSQNKQGITLVSYQFVLSDALVKWTIVARNTSKHTCSLL